MLGALFRPTLKSSLYVLEGQGDGAFPLSHEASALGAPLLRLVLDVLAHGRWRRRGRLHSQPHERAQQRDGTILLGHLLAVAAANRLCKSAKVDEARVRAQVGAGVSRSAAV